MASAVHYCQVCSEAGAHLRRQLAYRRTFCRCFFRKQTPKPREPAQKTRPAGISTETRGTACIGEQSEVPQRHRFRNNLVRPCSAAAAAGWGKRAQARRFAWRMPGARSGGIGVAQPASQRSQASRSSPCTSEPASGRTRWPQCCQRRLGRVARLLAAYG